MNKSLKKTPFWRIDSIQRTLLISSCTVLILVGGVSIAKLSHSVRDEMLEVIDANLIQYANSLYMLEQQIQGYNHVSQPLFIDREGETHEDEDDDDHRPAPTNRKPQTTTNHYKPEFKNKVVSQYSDEYSIAFQIWDTQNQQLIIRSNNAPTSAMVASFDTSTGFRYIEQKGSVWRLYAFFDRDKQRVIWVAQEQSLSNHLIYETLLRSVAPIGAGLLVLLLLFFLIIKRSLAPLTALKQHIEQRSPLHLHPIQLTHTPHEIYPVVQSVNQLMAKLEDSLTKERDFTGNAAHELRTPLAIIDTLTQTALKTQDLALLPKIKRATDQARRQIEQILTLARLDAQAGLTQTEAVNLYTHCQTVCADLYNIRTETPEIQLLGEREVWVQSTPELMYILLKNLIENALNHTPPTGNITLHLSAKPRPSLTISDTGCGIPEPQLALLTQRFYQAKPNTMGVGIGLSIVKRICTLHLATWSINNRDDGVQGVKVQIEF